MHLSHRSTISLPLSRLASLVGPKLLEALNVNQNPVSGADLTRALALKPLLLNAGINYAQGLLDSVLDLLREKLPIVWAIGEVNYAASHMTLYAKAGDGKFEKGGSNTASVCYWAISKLMELPEAQCLWPAIMGSLSRHSPNLLEVALSLGIVRELFNKDPRGVIGAQEALLRRTFAHETCRVENLIIQYLTPGGLGCASSRDPIGPALLACSLSLAGQEGFKNFEAAYIIGDTRVQGISKFGDLLLKHSAEMGRRLVAPTDRNYPASRSMTLLFGSKENEYVICPFFRTERSGEWFRACRSAPDSIVAALVQLEGQIDTLAAVIECINSAAQLTGNLAGGDVNTDLGGFSVVAVKRSLEVFGASATALALALAIHLKPYLQESWNRETVAVFFTPSPLPNVNDLKICVLAAKLLNKTAYDRELMTLKNTLKTPDWKIIDAALHFAQLCVREGVTEDDAETILAFGIRHPHVFFNYDLYRMTWESNADFVKERSDSSLTKQIIWKTCLEPLCREVTFVPARESVEASDLAWVEKIFRENGAQAHVEIENLLRRFSKPEMSFEGLVAAIDDNFCHFLLSSYCQGRAVDDDTGMMLHYLQHGARIDSPPYPVARESKIFSLEYQRCVSESVQTIFSGLQLYNGQGALMFAARRAGPNSKSQLVDFSESCCEQTDIISAGRTQYPGAGVVMKGLHLDRVVSKEHLMDGTIANTWQWAREVLEDTEQSAVSYLRGCRVVIPPERADKYFINQLGYALLSFQDHFGDPLRLGVIMVPRGGAVEFIKKCSLGHEFRDAYAVVRFLRGFCGDDSLLRLTWASNLGGLCNAWSVGSRPYWDWEMEGGALNSRYFGDRFGHIHKSHYGHIRESSDVPLESFQVAHQRLYEVSSRLFALESLWRIAMGRFAMGHYYGGEEGAAIYPGYNIERETPFPSYGCYMLKKALEWHNELKKQQVSDLRRYPLLVCADPLDYWGASSSEVYLDTENMVLSDRSGKVHTFASNNIGEHDEHLWASKIWRVAEEKGWELRFDHRDRVLKS